MSKGLAGAIAAAHMGLPNSAAATCREPARAARSAVGGAAILTAGGACGNAAPRRTTFAPLAIHCCTDLSRSRPLAKPEWGTKRICPSCGTRYYDLMRDPVVCPKCSTPFDPEAFIKARRSRPTTPVEKELEPVGADEIDPDAEADDVEAAEEEEDEELIEDASELGEDEDDMAEVIENVEDEEP